MADKTIERDRSLLGLEHWAQRTVEL